MQTQRLQQLAALTKQVAELAVTQADVDRAVAERRATVAWSLRGRALRRSPIWLTCGCVGTGWQDEALETYQKTHSVAATETELQALRAEQSNLEARWGDLMKQRERLSAQGHVRARLDQLEAERTDRSNVRQGLYVSCAHPRCTWTLLTVGGKWGRGLA